MVVFDDPVSSLDAEVLFIVSSLIRQVFRDLRASIGHVRQVFVLTHNIYFHKEVSYDSKGTDAALKDPSFWIVRKRDRASTVRQSTNNPIKTSYELLWSEVRNWDASNLNLQNTLRRILEHYFKILGGISLDTLAEKFAGKDQIGCRSLLSWVNDGSHSTYDDLYASLDANSVETHVRIFGEIFEKSDHRAHYDMMMRGADAAQR